MERRAVPDAQDHGWSLHSATDAVRELIRLVEKLAVPGWSWSGSTNGSGLDLRSEGDTEPVPLVLPDGQVLGTVRCPVAPTGDPADAILRALLQASVLAVALERRGWAAVDRAATAERQSRLDALTNLPNRRQWDEVLTQEQARCRRHRLRAVIAIVDLDDLKHTNDSQGHLAGDVLLRVAGQALREAVRDTDVVARLGGDEFALLGVDFTDDDPTGFARRVEQALAAAEVRASVGVAVGESDDDFFQVMAEADRRMYAAKRSRKAG